jgi:peptide/nickel transport system permease protein
MLTYIGRKSFRLVGVVIAVSILTFLIVSLLPGDVVYAIAGQDATPEDIEKIRQELGLNDSFILRYFKWAIAALAGDFGHSIRTWEPVMDAILSRLPVTVELLVLAQILATVCAVPVGVYSAYRAGTASDKGITIFAFGLISVPNFVFALILIYVFAIQFGVLPATGFVPLSESVGRNLAAMVLPVLAIALGEWVGLMRVLRSDMIGVLQEDYIAMARAKGLPNWHILFKHALRPSSFTLITILGLQIGALIGGALIVETIFALPGLGRLLVENIYARDYMMIQGCILFISVGYVVINFIVDLLYGVLDPRIRVEGAHG